MCLISECKPGRIHESLSLENVLLQLFLFINLKNRRLVESQTLTEFRQEMVVFLSSWYSAWCSFPAISSLFLLLDYNLNLSAPIALNGKSERCGMSADRNSSLFPGFSFTYTAFLSLQARTPPPAESSFGGNNKLRIYLLHLHYGIKGTSIWDSDCCKVVHGKASRWPIGKKWCQISRKTPERIGKKKKQWL